jgi:hypothetical protein
MPELGHGAPDRIGAAGGEPPCHRRGRAFALPVLRWPSSTVLSEPHQQTHGPRLLLVRGHRCFSLPVLTAGDVT